MAHGTRRRRDTVPKATSRANDESPFFPGSSNHTARRRSLAQWLSNRFKTTVPWRTTPLTTPHRAFPPPDGGSPRGAGTSVASRKDEGKENDRDDFLSVDCREAEEVVREKGFRRSESKATGDKGIQEYPTQHPSSMDQAGVEENGARSETRQGESEPFVGGNEHHADTHASSIKLSIDTSNPHPSGKDSVTDEFLPASPCSGTLAAWSPRYAQLQRFHRYMASHGIDAKVRWTEVLQIMLPARFLGQHNRTSLTFVATLCTCLSVHRHLRTHFIQQVQRIYDRAVSCHVVSIPNTNNASCNLPEGLSRVDTIGQETIPGLGCWPP